LLTLQAMVILGVSTGKVRKITAELCDVTFLRALVSQLLTELEVDIQAWLKRPLEGQYPYLIVDAECEEVCENHKVVSKSAIIIESIRETGRREISGVYVANSETETNWSEAFVDLKRRSLERVELVVSDAPPGRGLQDAIRRHFQGCL